MRARADLLRPRRLVALVLLVALVAGAVVNRETLAAQARAVVVLAAVAETPVLTDVAELLTREPDAGCREPARRVRGRLRRRLAGASRGGPPGAVRARDRRLGDRAVHRPRR